MRHFLRGAICVLVCSVSLPPGSPAQKPSEPGAPAQSDGVYHAVVQLLAVGPSRKGQNQECSATGFLVNDEGYILTNAHVVEKSHECLGKSSGAKIVARLGPITSPASSATQSGENTAPSISCDLVGLDDVHDLAVLKTERPLPLDGTDSSGQFARLDPTELSTGAIVKVTGHPVFAWLAVTQSGKIVGSKSWPLFEGSAEKSDVLILDFPLKRGSSGSPVYRVTGGGVVGVVERQDSTNLSQTVAVPIQYAIDLLNRLGVRWHALDQQSPEILRIGN